MYIYGLGFSFTSEPNMAKRAWDAALKPSLAVPSPRVATYPVYGVVEFGLPRVKSKLVLEMPR